MLDFESFREILKKKILHYMPPEHKNDSVDEIRVKKINITYEGIVIGCPDNDYLGASIYFDQAYQVYQRYGDVDRALRKLADEWLFAIKKKPNYDTCMGLYDYHTIKDNLICSVINTARNQDLLMDVPHREFHDLSVVYQIVEIPIADDVGNALITNAMIKHWGMDEEMLFEQAFMNTQKKYPTVIMAISDALGIPTLPEDDVFPLYVFSNQLGTFGASCILFKDKFREFAEQIDSDLYILPSSTHELIIASAKQFDKHDLFPIVREVNKEAVDIKDWLSDNIYCYTRCTDQITLIISDEGMEDM